MVVMVARRGSSLPAPVLRPSTTKLLTTKQKPCEPFFTTCPS